LHGDSDLRRIAAIDTHRQRLAAGPFNLVGGREMVPDSFGWGSVGFRRERS
jgi:hypothetical protein